MAVLSDEQLASAQIDGQQTIDGGEVRTAPIPPEELVVDGTVQLGLFDAGGKKPTSASLKLTGGKIGLLDGRGFRKGDTIELSVTAVVTAVAQQDKRDAKTWQVVSCEQQHTARITDLTIEG